MLKIYLDHKFRGIQEIRIDNARGIHEIHSSNLPVVTGICDPNKFQAQQHHSLKFASKFEVSQHTSATPVVR